MKKLFIILLFISSLFGKNQFLDPEVAFKASVYKTKKSVQFQIILDKSVYIYDEFLKVFITKPKKIDITKELKIAPPTNHDGFLVHYNKIIIDVPLKLIAQKIKTDQPFELKIEYQGCSELGLCYSPMSKTYQSQSSQIKQQITTQTKPTLENETDTITSTLKNSTIWVICITFFGFGLLLSLTPCIFPIIPILSSIIVQQSKNNNNQMSPSRGFFLSLIYVLSMSVAYTIAGVLAGLFGANIQIIFQNPIVIIIFAALFVALALSMFGYYEITLPSSWQSKLNKKSDESSKKGGILGVAIMGFLSALIVGPCVAPPLAGALIYIGQTGDALLGGVALFVMSLGMGVPLLLIGLGAGKYMPKAGGWMNTVSKIFGVVMLAIAIWMLDKIVPLSVTFALFALLALGSAIYLIKNTNIFGKLVALLLVILSIFLSYNIVQKLNSPKLHFKHITTITQLNHEIKTSQKPIMVDFWASWCVSCKELDNKTFNNEMVQKRLENYLLIKIDVTQNTKEDQALMKKYNIFGPPALLFFKNNKELKEKRIIGYKSSKEFLEILK